MHVIDLYLTEPLTGQQYSYTHLVPIQIGSAESCTLILKHPQVAPQHAAIEQEGGQIIIRSLRNKPDLIVNDQPAARTVIGGPARIQIGPFKILVMVVDRESNADSDVTRLADSDVTIPASRASALNAATQPDGPRQAAPQSAVASSYVWPPACFTAQRVAVRELKRLGFVVNETQYASIGGGLGSFVMTNLLRIAGVRPEQIAVIGPNASPYGHYGLLTGNSQIPAHERIRSNSESTPDCMWGFPGYASREIVSELRSGHFKRAVSVAWQIFGEPTLTDTYTPRIGDVFRSIDREAERVDWPQIFHFGRVQAIRMTDDGRYVIAFSTHDATGQGEYMLHIARYVHLALGYPTITFLPDLAQYREETGDFSSVVNAYENHDHIYDYLRQHGGLVILRGRGIVASRILQRLYEERAFNPNIAVIHLLRSPILNGRRYGRAQRKVIDNWEYQPFNWPRACWTGPYRKMLEHATPAERQRLLAQWGGTTTARRKDWVDLVRNGLREGWMQQVFGEVERVERDSEGTLVTVVKEKGLVSGTRRYRANFIIDATGLDARAMVNPLIRDMVEHYTLALNPLQRLHVEPDFEIPGMRNGNGRMYAAGAVTLGGPNAGVDTFLGLQYAAWRAVSSLGQAKAPNVRRVAGLRSVIEWIKWAGGIKP